MNEYMKLIPLLKLKKKKERVMSWIHILKSILVIKIDIEISKINMVLTNWENYNMNQFFK
jgi:hypothetical protein